ncbi:MAG: hypothetical protein IT483_07310 [Gammaproteobacteria bacterium]|nr:hypothetical protein [Gammaproteobacteria bacterium]
MMLSRRQFFGMIALGLPALRAHAGNSVVLVTTDTDPDFSLESIRLRKVFLGFAVLHDGHLLRPIRNRSDPRLDAVFLQHVVAMSPEAYERRLLSLSLQQGRPRPLEVRSRTDLLNAMREHAHAISFAWHSDVAAEPGIRVVRTLWRE